MHSVYTITFPSNKVYVGCTYDPDYRLHQHKETSPNRLFDREVKKYGWDDVNFDIVFNSIDRNQAEEKEKEFISKFSRISRSLNYFGNDNVTHDDYKELDHVDKPYRLVIHIDEELKQRFKDKVESEGRNMRYVLTQYIKEYTYDRKEKK